jgi:hypothetical protein
MHHAARISDLTTGGALIIVALNILLVATILLLLLVTFGAAPGGPGPRMILALGVLVVFLGGDGGCRTAGVRPMLFSKSTL